MSLDLSRVSLGLCITVALIACGQPSTYPERAAVTIPQRAVVGAAGHDFRYEFTAGEDGNAPFGSLIELNGTLYGTTFGGGGSGCGYGEGCGTVFTVNPSSGKESVLYRFQGGADGANPEASLVAINGTLYGTTYFGGGPGSNCVRNNGTGCGTIFAVDPSSGHETVLYSFQGGQDGANPLAGLTAVNSTLYGTTFSGGVACSSYSRSCGTIFAFNLTTGQEGTVYRFQGGQDGATPTAALLRVNNMLYGTTLRGGGKSCKSYGIGCGTIFRFDPSSETETVLYRFGGHKQHDGKWPEATLIADKGRLFGTTIAGGASGVGTIFLFNLASGQETVVSNFPNYNHARPSGQLLMIKGTLYGTTMYGPRHFQYGTVFALTPPSDQPTIVYRFSGNAGEYPQAGLVTNRHATTQHTLYGTTPNGGTRNPSYACCGTAFGIGI